MWSLGVMLYILLSGLPPFWGDDESQIFKSVLKVRSSSASELPCRIAELPCRRCTCMCADGKSWHQRC